jgi:hypothetical protein
MWFQCSQPIPKRYGKLEWTLWKLNHWQDLMTLFHVAIQLVILTLERLDPCRILSNYWKCGCLDWGRIIWCMSVWRCINYLLLFLSKPPYSKKSVCSNNIACVGKLCYPIWKYSEWLWNAVFNLGTVCNLIKESSCIYIFPTHTILMEHPPAFE